MDKSKTWSWDNVTVVGKKRIHGTTKALPLGKVWDESIKGAFVLASKGELYVGRLISESAIIKEGRRKKIDL